MAALLAAARQRASVCDESHIENMSLTAAQCVCESVRPGQTKKQFTQSRVQQSERGACSNQVPHDLCALNNLTPDTCKLVTRDAISHLVVARERETSFARLSLLVSLPGRRRKFEIYAWKTSGKCAIKILLIEQVFSCAADWIVRPAHSGSGNIGVTLFLRRDANRLGFLPGGIFP